MSEENKTLIEEEITTPVAEAKTEKTFTQAELDELIKKRLERATKDMPSKEDLTAYKKWQDEQKTEQQKMLDAKTEIEATLQKANDRYILAEIKALDGYDTKLVSRLIDKSKLKISDDGEVTGLKEALVELEAEFPQIKIAAKTATGANPPLSSLTEVDKLKEQYGEAEKRKDMPLMMSIMAQIKKKK